MPLLPRSSFRLTAVVNSRVPVQEPVPNITAHPSTSSILVWHYVLEGPKGSEYEGGFYWGKIEFPSDCESNLTGSSNTAMVGPSVYQTGWDFAFHCKQ